MQLDTALTAAQQNVLNHLAAGKSIAQTAELCGVHRNTIANWRRDLPAFTAQLDESIRERSALLQELIPQAIEVLRTTLHNEKASPSLRFRAALAVLKMASFLPPTQTASIPEKPAQVCTSFPTPEPESAPDPNWLRLFKSSTPPQITKNLHNSAQRSSSPSALPRNPAATPRALANPA